MFNWFKSNDSQRIADLEKLVDNLERIVVQQDDAMHEAEQLHLLQMACVLAKVGGSLTVSREMAELVSGQAAGISIVQNNDGSFTFSLKPVEDEEAA